MKKKTLIVEDDRLESKRKIILKLVVAIVLIVLCVTMTFNIIKINKINEEFSESIAEMSKINSKTVFSIDRIYLYSSADAISKETNKPIWDLDVYQFTDIALYINNKEDEELTYENTIKRLTIDNIKFNGLETGTPSLYYKNVNDFAKLDIAEENRIDNKLEFNVVSSGIADYTKPVIYSNCQNPITLEYINSQMKEETKITDITNPLTYDGSLLKKAGILLTNIKCTLSFKITIENYYGQKFIATAYIDIPLEEEFENTSIYDGKIIKNIQNSNIIKFVRVK